MTSGVAKTQMGGAKTLSRPEFPERANLIMGIMLHARNRSCFTSGSTSSGPPACSMSSHSWRDYSSLAAREDDLHSV